MVAALPLFLFPCAAAAAADPTAPEASSPRAPEPADAVRAEALYRQGNCLDALPQLEALARREPRNARYAEELTHCLLAQFEILPEGEERTAVFNRAKAEAERARSLGDSSNLLQTFLERLAQPVGVKRAVPPAYTAAETAFARGDLQAALSGYEAAAQADPGFYEAPLFAGDVCFRMHDAKGAGEWFAKAIAVDPDRETAYRYWGDALMASGDQYAALQKFIDAVVAEPYTRRSWLGLSQWATRSGAKLKPPAIQVPKAPTMQSGGASKPGVTITVGPEMQNHPDTAGVWLVYSATRALWREETFAKRFPDEPEYRHSLDEELESLQAAVFMIATLKISERQLDANLGTLSRLARDGMLEPYVLLSAADDGIARDYPAYRAAHRDRLHAYVERYVVSREDVK